MFRLVGAVAVLLFVLPAIAEAAMPGQFIAKLYTEALGRAPEPAGWAAWVAWFQSSGCSPTTLGQAGLAFFNGQEYASLGYDNTEKILTAYRAIVNREPDATAIPYWRPLLDSGAWTFSALVNYMFTWAEFTALVPAICAGAAYGGPGNIGFSGGALDNAHIPAYDTGYSGDQAGLQALINSSPPGAIVFLKKRAVITLTSTLTIRNGVVLATTGWVGPRQYAKQARLVRVTEFAGPMVRLEAGGATQLYNIWISGQRHLFGTSAWDASMNIQHAGGDYGRVGGIRSDTPYGWTHLQALGSHENGLCANLHIWSNLLTGYTSSHSAYWTDGISNACDNAEIDNNNIVDPTDVGIVVFSTNGQQSSRIYANTIVAAGRSMYGGIVLDTRGPWCCPGAPSSPRFGGTNVELNNLMTSPTQHMDIVLVMGLKPWNETAYIGVAGSAANPTVRMSNNTFHQGQFRVGLVVDGMREVEATGNALNGVILSWSCPSGFVFWHPPTDASAWALQPALEVPMHNCIVSGL